MVYPVLHIHKFYTRKYICVVPVDVKLTKIIAYTEAFWQKDSIKNNVACCADIYGKVRASILNQ